VADRVAGLDALRGPDRLAVLEHELAGGDGARREAVAGRDGAPDHEPPPARELDLFTRRELALHDRDVVARGHDHGAVREREPGSGVHVHHADGSVFSGAR
jgi:hypothetical protein